MIAVIDFGGVETIDALDMLEELKAHDFRLVRRRANGITTWSSATADDHEWVEGCLEEQCGDGIRLVETASGTTSGKGHKTPAGI